MIFETGVSVVINGRHDDWPGEWPYLVRRNPIQIKGNAAAWKNHRDASFGFAAAHDGEFVYIAVDVIDGELERLTRRYTTEIINEIEVTDQSSLLDSARDYWITAQLRTRLKSATCARHCAHQLRCCSTPRLSWVSSTPSAYAPRPKSSTPRS